MKKQSTLFSFLLILFGNLYAQVINKSYNSSRPVPLNTTYEINAAKNSTSITADALYNAIPDGYILTYTRTFVGKTVDEMDAKANKLIDDLIIDLVPFEIHSRDVTIDLISFDPVFDFYRGDSILPDSYRITQNISINIKKINQIGKITQKCLDHGIHDLINVQAYLIKTDAIQDSLDLKVVEILNKKKKLCEEVGVGFANGEPHFTNYKEVFYPNEKYLKSYIQNATYFSHNETQNASTSLQRKVEVDNYYDFNLKNADFVFHPNNNQPVIQFYSQIQYGYEKVDTEAEIREKIKKEEESKPVKEYYMLDKDGNLVKMGM